MDQKFLEQELRKETKTGFENAKAIYREGGNSKAIARVALITPLTEDIAEGTEFVGKTDSTEEINLILFKKGERGSTQLHFRYGISSFQEYYNQCRVGALPAKDRIMTGCTYLRIRSRNSFLRGTPAEFLFCLCYYYTTLNLARVDL